MIYIIDTSSLSALVKYFLRFDRDDAMLNYFEHKIKRKQIIVIDKVAIECRYISKGEILKKLDFIDKKVNQVNTELVSPPKKFFNMLDNNFHIPAMKAKLNEVEFDHERSEYLNNADARMILLALEYKKKGLEITIVTEETATANDNKLFKKIPAICKILSIDCMSLPELIEGLDDLNVDIKAPSKSH